MSNAVSNSIEKQVVIQAPVGFVWRALVDYREFGEWFRVKLEKPFVQGETTQGQITYPGYEHVRMKARVDAIEPMKRFAFSWHPGAVDPNIDYTEEPLTLVEFWLEEADSSTTLTVIESGFDAISPDRREEAYRMNEGGWEEQVKNIRDYVESNG